MTAGGGCPRVARKQMEGELKAGRYRIGKKIAGGGMGDVYHATDSKLDRHVALKVIKPQYLHDTQYRKRLELEAKLAAKLSHHGIAQVYDYDDDGKDAFIVYEFIEGVTLQKRLTDGHCFSTQQVLEIGIEIADALTAIQGEGFIHRDLKPANIMLTPRTDGEEHVKVLDFGLVKRLPITSDQAPTAPDVASLTHPGIQPGTIDYMSPEQLRSEHVDQRSDIHAVGLILYEMAAGVNPYRGRDTASTIANILTREPIPLSDRNSISSPGLDRVIRKCLRKNRDERYQSANELLADLRNITPSEQQAEPRPVPPPPPAETRIPRWLACALFTAIQIGYLVMYAAAFSYLPDKADRLPEVIMNYDARRFVVATLIVLCGAATVRLYLLAAVAFDYEDLGRLFRRIFPGILALDIAWAMAPLLLFLKLGFILMLGVPALAYLPFSQRTLVFYAYGRRGGRSSAAPAPSSPPSRPASSPAPPQSRRG